MATRKAITLVSGLFQEVNTPTDKLDFAGNTTADLGENTNLYYTDARSRAAVSVTDSGGFGSLAYNNSTGVITYVGTSNSDVRGTLSVASGNGLTYNSGTGEFGTSAIPNSQLANSSVTLGATNVALGATASTISGLTSLTSTTLVAGSGANSILLASGSIQFEGSTANDFETSLTVTDPTADRTITFPDATGTVALLSTLSIASGSGLTYNSSTGEFSTNAIPNSQLANSSVTVGSTGIALGGSATTITGLSSITSSAVVTDDNGFRIRDNSDNTKQLAFECSGISGSTTRTLTVPDASDTLVVLAAAQTLTNKTIALGSNTVTGALANGITATTQSASDNSTKVATTAYVDNQVSAGGTNEFADNVFRVKDNSDASKKLAFECSGISGSTTRTMTVPNTDGTISTESFATAIAVALG